METQLKQAYREQLIQAGVCQNRAVQVAETLTPIELEIITEIWSDWAVTWNQLNDPRVEAAT